jgi:AAA15 family ATPase/GTPase
MIQQIKIENFLNFKPFQVPRLASINLLIGDNDTGKTSLLKLLYAVSKSWEIYSRNSYENLPFKKVLAKKLFDTFQPRKNKLGELVTKGVKDKLNVSVGYSIDQVYQNLSFKFGSATKNTVNDCTDSVTTLDNKYNVIFIPAKEVLTAFQAIKFTREPHYLPGFDDTYLDLIKCLEIPALESHKIGPLNDIHQQLEQLLGGQISQFEDDFLFKKGHQEFTMSMTADGLKKLGTFTTLIQNRQLHSHTMLFLDEIENALHPKAIRHLVKMIVRLASYGVQVFLSSNHDFVINQLSICARRENMSIFCFSLSKNQNEIDTRIADLKDNTPDNLIVDEALKMFDEDVELDFRN